MPSFVADPPHQQAANAPGVLRRRGPRIALDCLEDDPQAYSLQKRAETLLQLEGELRQLCTLPVRVAALREKVLVIMASGALAARLRQQTPSILAHLRERGWALEGLRFKARPLRSTEESPEPSQRLFRPAAIPEQARDCLSQMLPHIHDPKLKASLRALLRRA